MAIDRIFNDANVDGIADNIFGAVNNSVSEVKQMQQRKAAENVQMVVEAFKKIETNITEKFDNVTDVIEKRVLTIKDGRDGSSGSDGRNGRDGKPGRDGVNGKQGTPGAPGKDGVDGVDGVSVTDASIDFDGSLVISLSSGQQINVGEVVPPELERQLVELRQGGSAGSSGDVAGPTASTDNAIVRFDGTTGKLVQNSVVTIADTTGNMAGVGTLGVGAITTTGALIGTATQNAFNTVSTTLNLGGAATAVNIGAATGTATVANATLAAKAITATSIVSSGTAASSFTVTSGSAVPLTITNVGAGNSFVVEDSASTDSTPFVIDANGATISGHTASINTVAQTGNAVAPGIQQHAAAQGFATLGTYSWSSNAGISANYIFSKSNSGTVGTRGIVASGTLLGANIFTGDDGTNFIRAAAIEGWVDGTPGTNDMPGRLVFSTTADGASTPTERMRIDSSGNVWIGGTAGGAKVQVTGTYPSLSNVTRVIYEDGIIPAATTTAAIGFSTALSTEAASFTLSQLRHFYASQATIGATSTVTNQYGFWAESNLTGATNNYGVYSAIASGTNRYNFYAGGTAANLFAGVSQFAAGTAALPGITQISDLNTGIFFPAADTLGFTTGGTERVRIDSAGNVGIGGVPIAGYSVNNVKNITGGGVAAGQINQGVIQSDVTTTATMVQAQPSTAAAAFTLSNLRHFGTFQNTIGAGSTVTNQIGFNADASLTGATNNYGFYSNIASGTSRYNFYAAGTADNYFAGRVGIAAFASANTSQVIIGGTNTFGAYASGVAYVATFGAGVITRADSFVSFPNVNTGGPTLTQLNGYYASQGTLTTTVTNQTGVYVDSLIGATNNYGFYSNIASTANRWNFYAAGTARNYMAADLTVNGATAIPAGGTAGAGLMVSTTANFGVFFGSGAPTLSAAKGSLYLRSDGSTVNDRMYVNTNGSTTWTNVTTAA